MGVLKNFIEKIDCKFPYNDQSESFQIIDEATKIGSEAVYAVVHEVVRVPKSQAITVELGELYLNRLYSGFKHPLKSLVFGIANSLISKRPVSESEVIAALNAIKSYPGNYSALNVAYFACWSQEVDDLYTKITTSWQK